MNDAKATAKEVFLNALDCTSPEDLVRFLDESCAGDVALRSRVEELLRAQREAGSFLGGRWTSATEELAFAESPGAVIGPYKLLQQIGEGGMGVVFMAEQTDPIQRRVALKIIKPGMDTRQVIARFEAERQALAVMDHPNIAKVLDAGTTDSGRPYFVMELVKGVPITKYCDEKQLPLQARLGLFVQVCHAVQHAHQKGIIHRDIKPSNVLVAEYDNHAVPKVIDFGVAKATAQRLTERTMFTEFGQVLGTMEYMSPEQSKLNQLDIDTRSDIYSLGVLLYELLAGSTPFGRKRLNEAAFDEMLRIIREDEPPKPSTRLSSSDELPSIAANRGSEPLKLNRLVQGELDWIVMKALEKDRDRRYETASGFAADIERHLQDEPVMAGPPSAAYRLKKFVRRNQSAVLAGSAIVAAVVVGLAVASLGFVQARREAIRADHAAEIAQTQEQIAHTQAVRSEQVARFLKDMLNGVAPSVALGRDTTLLKEIVDQTANRIDKDLNDQPEVQIELNQTLGQVYLALQLYKQMEANARHTLKLARAHFGEENIAVADALGQLGRALLFLRAADEGEKVTRQAIAMQRKVRGESSVQEADSLCNLADILRHMADVGGDIQKRLAEAETAARAGLAIRRERLGNDCDETAWAFHVLSIVLVSEKKDAEAETAIREALAIRLKIHGEEHPFTAADVKMLGSILLSEGKLDEAEDSVRKSLSVQEKMDGQGKLAQARAHFELGSVLRKRGKLKEAETQYREAVSIGEREAGPEYLDLPGFLAALARVLTEEGKLAEAQHCAEQAVGICRRHPDQIEHWQHDRAVTALSEVLLKVSGNSEKHNVPKATDTEPTKTQHSE